MLKYTSLYKFVKVVYNTIDMYLDGSANNSTHEFVNEYVKFITINQVNSTTLNVDCTKL